MNCVHIDRMLAHDCYHPQVSLGHYLVVTNMEHLVRL